MFDHIGECHAVAWLPDFTMPTHPDHVGALVDNDPRVGALSIRVDRVRQYLSMKTGALSSRIDRVS